jgi:D-alanyl-lipoteichoic acid acyltransferase DltB (MBOAT superfamily)
MVFNYAVGKSLNEEKEHKRVSKKQLLTIGIVGDIGLLGYFKYSDFLIANFNLVSNSEIGLLHLALPLAISFFTFQQIAYLVDSYRGETKEYDFLNYGVFVTFFPQLIAGPIVHHKEMMPQFGVAKNKVINYNNIALGLFLFSLGLFKKVAIADTFAIWATYGFDQAEVLTFFEAWVTSLSYTFELYFDFSGYTDMALGVALLFNIRLPINFDSPYKASNIQDFWRRWHITLSRFLKEYVYVPLGGNRDGSFNTSRNLMTTFIIGGLWHGAGWTFIFWGFLHGAALVLHRIWSHFGIKMPLVVGWFLTFNFINISWVFFRAKSWDDAMRVLHAMMHPSTICLPKDFFSFVEHANPINTYMGKFVGSSSDSFVSIFSFEMLVVGFFIVLVLPNSNSYLKKFSLDMFMLFLWRLV